jgi:uncharacterized protein (DUF305 family)
MTIALQADHISTAIKNGAIMGSRPTFLTAFAAAALVTVACNTDSTVGPRETELSTAAARIESAPAPEASIARYEVDFLKNMIDHHAMAVEMGEMCLDKNLLHAELAELCASIVQVQSEEISKMQNWLQSWYGIQYEPEMKQGSMKQMERLNSLDGAEFEIAFMEMMIKHHSKAIKEGQRCIDRAYHEALIDACEDIVASQKAEIETMESWLCQWYGMCS